MSISVSHFSILPTSALYLAISALVKGFFDSCLSFIHILFRDANIKEQGRMEVTTDALKKVKEAEKRVRKDSDSNINDILEDFNYLIK